MNPSGTVVIAVAPNAHIRTVAGNNALIDLAALLGGSATALKLKGIADSGGALTAWEIDQD